MTLDYKYTKLEYTYRHTIERTGREEKLGYEKG